MIYMALESTNESWRITVPEPIIGIITMQSYRNVTKHFYIH